MPERLHRWADWRAQKLRRILIDEMRDAQAGAKTGGVASTPFKRTCLTLRKFIEKHPGTLFAHAMERIQHHYSSVRSARSNIEFILKTAELEMRDGCLYVPGAEPSPAEPAQAQLPKPAVQSQKNNTAVVRCSGCRGVIALFKYESIFGINIMQPIRPELENHRAYLEWESHTDLPPFTLCGCNGRQRAL